MTDVTKDGCEFCGELPEQLHIHARCHPSAPLRAEITGDGQLLLYCYLPECNRRVGRFAVSEVRP